MGQADADADVISFELGGIFGADEIEISEINKDELPDKVFSELVYNVTEGKPGKFQNAHTVCNKQ